MTEKIKILGSKAEIFRNKFGVWQFRFYVKEAKKNIYKSLHTKEKTIALERGEDLYIEIRNDIKKGKSFVGLSIKDGISAYLEYRKKEVGMGDNGIVEGRYHTIVSHLKRFLTFVNKDTKVADLGVETLTNYEVEGEELSYLVFRTRQKAASSTIRNEMATINACQRYLYDIKKVASVPRFILPKMRAKQYDVDTQELVRRQTFTREEYQAFFEALRKYVSKTQNIFETDEEYLERELFRHWVLFAANSGCRMGELRQLKWDCVSTETDGGGNRRELLLAKVFIRRETTKVRQSRTLYCRGGQYIDRWQNLLRKHNKKAEGYVFSIEGDKEYPKTNFHRHWKRVMRLSDISGDRKPLLVPYSLRHYMITQRVMSGCKFSDVAYMCGTSVKQIEATYYHLNEAMMKTTARADYIERDGVIIPIGSEV